MVARLNSLLIDASCFRDNRKKGFLPSIGVRGVSHMGILGLDLFILVLGIFEKFIGI